MQKILLISFMCGAISCSTTHALDKDKPAKPQVFVLDLKTLKENKSRVNAKDAAIIPAFKLLVKDAEKALERGPVSVMEKVHTPPSGDKHDYMSLAPYHWPDPAKANGLPYIRRDGETNPEVKDYKDKEYMPKLCSDVQTLALAYYFTDERKYADHAAKLLRVWFLDTATRMNPNLNFGQAIKGVTTGRGAGLIDTRHFVKLIDAIGLLNGSSAWTGKDQKGMQQWFGDFLDWMQTSKIGLDEMKAQNNHGAWYDAQRLAMALFIGNSTHAKQIALHAAERLDKQMDDAGKFPKEMERTISLHYTSFVMDAFFTIANMADDAGVDFWSHVTPGGKSLKKAFDVLHPYLTKQKDWEGKQIKGFNYEDGYFLLMEGEKRFGCKNCRDAVKKLAADKAERLRINLLY